MQAWLEDQDVSYVMAVRCSDTLTTPAGKQRADALNRGGPGRCPAGQRSGRHQSLIHLAIASLTRSITKA